MVSDCRQRGGVDPQEHLVGLREGAWERPVFGLWARVCVCPTPNAPHPPKHIHTPMWGTCGGGGGAGGPRGEAPSSMSVPPPPPQAQSDTHVGDMWGRRRSRGTSRRGIMWNIGWASGRVRGTGRCPPPPPQAHSHTHGVDAQCGRRGVVRLIPTPSTG